ncbi:DUF1934 domain-containing protein [Halanaerobacter jeridensis]|uniref:Uncharacterized beta-barrel protein YwiB (DUF1934 family) n=1 Tax=Halanaerobacter jeridensis TaxID=706427 RepID=A0A939BMP2_9FIRM|nr:DUF1934 domain-containing protein [Halanaerobacter jeridensis]MBM7557045.1 uncharacterized beta-barrel protein YwiB (DUF1934 family) [Halanaerobacter jeridensis]
MSQAVRINVESSQDDGSEQEEITTQSTGELYQKRGTYYLKYEETAEGLEGVKTTVKIKEEEITLIRQGQVRTIQNFVPESRTQFDYKTPYGTLNLALEVEEFDLDINERAGEINLEYAVYSEEGLVSNNQLAIKYFCEGD